MYMMLYVTAWHAEDVRAEGSESGDGVCNVIAFGKQLGDDRSVAVRVPFTPFFYARIPPEWSEARSKAVMLDLHRFGLVMQRSGAVSRKSLWGFEARPSQFLQLAFNSQGGMKKAASHVRNSLRLETFESSVDPVIKALHSRDLASVGWMQVDAANPVSARITTCDLELVASPQALSPAQAPPGAKPPVTVASWDIECYSASRLFPDARKDDDCIICIATTVSRLGDPASARHSVMCLHETDQVPGVDVRSFASEEDLIEAWIESLADEKVDLLIGYNTDGFDWSYVLGRQQVLIDGEGDEMVRLTGLGRMKKGGGLRVEKTLNSAAYGQNKFVRVSSPGVVQMDLLTYMRREYKLESYSLNSVSAAFLGDTKIDLPASRIFDLFEHGGPAGRATIAQYASKDTALPVRLLEKLRIFTSTSELANACSIPIDAILTRGQQLRVFSCVVKTARTMGFAVPDNRAITPPEGEKYEGATVLEPVTGAHTEPVCTLDFASLYPSIIRAQNYCWSTLVLEQEPGEGVEVDAIDTPLGTYRWVQGVKGVLPTLLERLAEMRKAAKRDLAAAKLAGDDFLAALLDSKQLAVKVVMNSAYG